MYLLLPMALHLLKQLFFQVQCRRCCHCSVTKSCVTFATPWTAACQASLSFTISWSLLRLMALSQWCHPMVSSSVAKVLELQPLFLQWIIIFIGTSWFHLPFVTPLLWNENIGLRWYYIYLKSHDLIALSGGTDQDTVNKKGKFIVVIDIIYSPMDHCPT